MKDFERRVRERAHQLWVDEGHPQGRADEHWERARELVEKEDRVSAPSMQPRHQHDPGPVMDHDLGIPTQPSAEPSDHDLAALAEIGTTKSAAGGSKRATRARTKKTKQSVGGSR
jgi:hypothetical protein